MERKKTKRKSFSCLCQCFVLNNGKDNFGKFDSKSDEAIFLGFSPTSKTYHVFNKRTLIDEESIHIVFDESNFSISKNIASNDDADIE